MARVTFPCCSCKQQLPAEDFYVLKSGKRQSACKACGRKASKAWIKENPEAFQHHQRKSWLKRKYGITIEQYEAELAAQGGVCAICRKPENVGKSLAVDHCHHTGQIRGLLCDSCNQALGMLKESPALILRAHDYLLEHTGHG